MFSIVTIYIFFMDLMRRLFHINHALAHYITTLPIIYTNVCNLYKLFLLHSEVYSLLSLIVLIFLACETLISWASGLGEWETTSYVFDVK